MALTKSVASVTDWTAVAQAAVGESAEVDISGCYESALSIQAFLDTGTAHVGTEFIVQVSSTTSGDEDWQDYTRFVELVGTANQEPLTNDPAAAGTTVLTCADTTGYTVADVAAPWRAIKDSTLANSELILQVAVSANTSITIQDGTTNAHVKNTNMYSIACTKEIWIPISYNRVRVIVNNDYDSDGSTLNYKVRINKVTAL